MTESNQTDRENKKYRYYSIENENNFLDRIFLKNYSDRMFNKFLKTVKGIVEDPKNYDGKSPYEIIYMNKEPGAVELVIGCNNRGDLSELELGLYGIDSIEIRDLSETEIEKIKSMEPLSLARPRYQAKMIALEKAKSTLENRATVFSIISTAFTVLGATALGGYIGFLSNGSAGLGDGVGAGIAAGFFAGLAALFGGYYGYLAYGENKIKQKEIELNGIKSKIG